MYNMSRLMFEEEGRPYVDPSDNQHSIHSRENCRYSLTQTHIRDHQNEDRYFLYTTGKGKEIFGLMDGFEGDRSIDYMYDIIKEKLTSPDFVEKVHEFDIVKVLKDLFADVETKFFDKKHNDIKRSATLSKQVKGMTAYEAYVEYPETVNRIRNVEYGNTGGATVVIAILLGPTLYLANVGTDRAYVIELGEGETLTARQLTQDHDFDNEEELSRLESLGYDSKKLKKLRRLESRLFTRCIGDYTIKGGFPDTDDLRYPDFEEEHPPGSAVPTIQKIQIPKHTRYLLLMTDGVYNSLEDMNKGVPSYDAIQDLIQRIKVAELFSERFENVARSVLVQLEQDHLRTFEESAAKDRESPLALQCRKRDDMTLLVYRFSQHRIGFDYIT